MSHIVSKNSIILSMQNILNTQKKYFSIIIIGILVGPLLYFLALPQLISAIGRKPLPPQPIIHMVSLYKDRSVPDEVVVKVGEYIQFNSKDGGHHSIAEGMGTDDHHMHDHNNFGSKSGTFGADEAYKVVFNKIGAYYFHDHLNPTSITTVLVYDPTKN
jgi:hypothetical protein